jgi:hypothetical protein
MPRMKKASTENETPASLQAAAPAQEAKTSKTRSKVAGSAKKTVARKKAAKIEAPQAQAVEQAPVQLHQEVSPASEYPELQATNQTALPGCSVSEYEQIALLAYSFWASRGYQGGSPEEDWFRAEQEVRRRRDGRLQANAAVE